MPRLSWQLAVYELLNATTRPVGQNQPMLSAEEQQELRRCWMNGWSPEAFAEMLQKRDEHLKMVG
jgi:hypothetical protein